MRGLPTDYPSSMWLRYNQSSSLGSNKNITVVNMNFTKSNWDSQTNSYLFFAYFRSKLFTVNSDILVAISYIKIKLRSPFKLKHMRWTGKKYPIALQWGLFSHLKMQKRPRIYFIFINCRKLFTLISNESIKVCSTGIMETNYCISHCWVWILIPFIQSQSRNSYIDQFFYNDGVEGWNEGRKWAGIREQ